jgi:hypothetical protein
MRWQPHLFGYWAQGLCHEVQPIHDWVNEQLSRFQEAEKLTPKAVCLYPIGSDMEDKVLTSNEDGINIPFVPVDGVGPTWQNPASYNEASLQLLNLNFEKGFELSGVNQLMSAARKESGITANSAIKTVQNMQSRRFSVVQKNFERWHVGVFEQMIWRAEEMADAKVELRAEWAQGDFIEEIGFDEVRIEDQPYTIQIAPVAGQKNSPADRLQGAAELNSQGKLSDDAFMRIQVYLDTLSEMEKHEKQTALIDRYITQ